VSEPPVSTPEQEQARAERQLERMQDAAREAAALTASARTPDGAATVVVGAGGAVLSIDVRAGADVARRGAALLAERTGVDITERVLAAQVLAGDPVAVGLAQDRAAAGGTGAAEESGDVDWLSDDPR
jgi:hypothetical protein